MLPTVSLLLFTLIRNTPEGSCEFTERFISSRVPIKDFKGLLDLLGRMNTNPITQLVTPEVIEKYGYKSESHEVYTKDGYILTMHRIPHGKAGKSQDRPSQRPAVYLQHGLFASSFEWFMNEEHKLLPLRLADAGYDVWLGNARGNSYSRKHRSLTVQDRSFWEFSVNEMGKYDIPAEIDYVLAATGQKQLSYVGYSMGTTMFWVMLSHLPEYNSKAKLMIALAPVVYLNNSQGIARFLAPIPGSEKPLKAILDLFGNGEFLPPLILKMFNSAGSKLCSVTYLAETICTTLVFWIAGYDLPQTQVKQLPVFFSHAPSPTSTRTISHMAQFMNTGHFREYDFGGRQNYIKYGNFEPPDYKLQNIQVPVALIYGLNDAVVSHIDAKRLTSTLPNVVLDMPVNFTFWNHLDYHIGRDANELVHDHILNLLSKF